VRNRTVTIAIRVRLHVNEAEEQLLGVLLSIAM
jgi:hypothetical protein